MQLLKNFITVLWVFSLLLLAACSHAPVRGQPTPAAPAGTGSAAPGAPSREQTARSVIVETARSMLGTRYRYGGSSPAGFDCSGLVIYAHQRAGIGVPRTAWQQHRSAPRPVAPRNLAAGDLVFFRIGVRRSAHVGIYVGSGAFIHAPSSGGKVSTTRLDNPYWRKRFIGAGNYYPAQP